MIGLRYSLCGLAAVALGVGAFYIIGQTGLAGEGGLEGGIYSNLVTYPAVILVGCFGFWIAFAASDPGSGK
jgi:hypothetical protein